MNDLGVLERMYFIVDANGKFYHLSSDGQLVQARDKAEADMFSFIEANQRIGGGRKSKFYSTIPVDEELLRFDADEKDHSAADPVSIYKSAETRTDFGTENSLEEKENYNMGDLECIEKQSTSLTLQDTSNLAAIDWSVYLKDFCYIVTSMGDYRKELAKSQSLIEQEIQDLLHFIELYDIDDEQSLETMRLLQDARERRRCVKDELQKTEWFQNAIGNNANAVKAKTAIRQMEKMENRTYHPRIIPELFKNAKLREKMSSEVIDDPQAEPECAYGQEEEDTMAYDRIETVYDEKKMDWELMAKQQLEFFANVQQHIRNLKIDLHNLDIEVEKTLAGIEDANCNAAQGYQVFKKLKNLRKERKEKERELVSVQTIADCFDCPYMTDAYEYSLHEIQKINGNMSEISGDDVENHCEHSDVYAEQVAV